MPQDTLAGKFITPTRDQDRDRWLANYQRRIPAADISEGTDLWAEASAYADSIALDRANALTLANGVMRKTARGDQLTAFARLLGTDRLPATGAAGAVKCVASTGGVFVDTTREFKIGNVRYACVVAKLYQTGDEIPIVAKDTGPLTNQRPGTIGKWSNPPPGLAPAATVVTQADGTGLTGGHEIESDDELDARLDDLQAHPPASGNDSEYQILISRISNVPIQRAFTYPAGKGPGSKVIVFTLRPSKLGGSRLPSATHIALVLAFLSGAFPGDDGIFVCTLTANAVNVNMKATWSVGAGGWVDAKPWPAYGGTLAVIDGSQPLTPTTFTIGPSSASAGAPLVGQSIGVFDLQTGIANAAPIFRRKKIKTVTANGFGWAITVDTTNGVSDTSYTPLASQVVCPWSDSLNDAVTPVVSYFDTLGPGEQFAGFFDPGLRQKRSPPNPQSWPSSITNRVLTNLFPVPSVQDIALVDPTVPYAAPVGSSGVSSVVNTLGNLAIFPQ